MAFTDSDKLKAVAIVSIFETGKAFGDFSSVTVLNDGAGISYGINQFTHRSGALAAVLDKYLENGGEVARTAIENGLVQARKKTPKAIGDLAADGRFKNSLRAAALTREMKEAQIDIAFERFLKPAVDECEKLEFVEPLSLAVVYDSITHGSWEKLRDEIEMPALGAAPILEHSWIAEYVKTRDAWLASIPRLAATRYRPKFFLGQIERENWKLNLPLLVHGVSLTSRTISNIANDSYGQQVCIQNSAVEPSLTNSSPSIDKSSVSSITLDDPPIEAQPPKQQEEEKRREGDEEMSLDRVEADVDAAAEKYDQAGRIVTTVTSRTDAAKSFWTTVIGSVTQAFWALLGLLAGVPREVWFVVAVIVAVLMVMYLYRQIALGKIRESRANEAQSHKQS